jgi:hypothetical protein
MKKTLSSSLVVGLLILSLCLMPGLFPRAAQAEAVPAGDYVPGQVIVGFKDGVSLDQARSTAESVLPNIDGVIKETSADGLALAAKCEGAEGGLAATTRAGVAPPQAVLIELADKSPEAMSQAIAELKKVEGVKFAEPNGIIRIPEAELKSGNPEYMSQATAATESVRESKANAQAPEASAKCHTNDPLITAQWGYYFIDAQLTPAFPTSAPTVAVISTGVDYNHPDLKGRVIKGPNYVDGTTDPMDDNGLGTAVAGIIYAVKVLTMYGGVGGTWWNIGQGIQAAALRPDVKVILVTFAGILDSADIHTQVDYAYNDLRKIVVAPAGDMGGQAPLYPAAQDTCMAVAASAKTDWITNAKLGGSCWGDWVDIAAPGENIITTAATALVPAGYTVKSGTNMAAAFVAGAAARVWAFSPLLTNAQVITVLQSSSVFNPLQNNGWPVTSNFGRLDLFYALGHNNWMIDGWVLDARTGFPVAGAKMTVKQTVGGVTTVIGTDTVPPGTVDMDTAQSGGFVAVFVPTTTDPYTVTFSKTGYGTVTLKNVYGLTPLDIVPMVKAGAAWTVAVTWFDDTVFNELHGWLPTATPYQLAMSMNSGDMMAFPWARVNRTYVFDGIPLETISLKKKLPGVYSFALNTNSLDDSYLRGSHAVAWVFKGTTLKAVVPIITLGSGKWWSIGTISTTPAGTQIFTPVNQITVGDPGPY